MSFRSFDSLNSDYDSLSEEYLDENPIVINASIKKTNFSTGISFLTEKGSKANFEATGTLLFEPKKLALDCSFNTDHQFVADLNIDSLFGQKSSHKFSGIYDANLRKFHAIMNHSLATNNFHGGVNLKFIKDLIHPLIKVHFAFGYQNYFAGLHSELDLHRGKIDGAPKTKICAGYSFEDIFTFHGMINYQGNLANMSYSGTIFQKLTDDFSCGGQVTWHRNESKIEASLCSKMNMDYTNNSFVKFKLNYPDNSIIMAYGFDLFKGFGLAFRSSYGIFSKLASLGISINADL